MSSQADKLREQARKVQQRQQAAGGSKVAGHTGAVAPLAKPVRRTVDLSPTQHAQLAAWCTETAREIGRARVTGQDVLRALVARLLTDEVLARKIRADLRDQ